MTQDRHRIRVSLVVIPDAYASTLSGLYDLFNLFGDVVPASTLFEAEILSPSPSVVETASGLPITPHRALAQVPRTDIVILPSLRLDGGEWRPGRYPELVNWLSAMHGQGAMLCSACSGALLLAETGLLDGREATVHWAYGGTFRRCFPRVKLRLDRALVATGDGERLVMSGASASWHDLALYAVIRHAGPAAAQSLADFFLLQWHVDGQAPYIRFQEETNHGDAVVLAAQAWLHEHLAEANPVERMVRESGLPERSFKRRFRKATGHPPIGYVQHLRVEAAKQQLETTTAPIDEISWSVGYEDPAFFRRVFKRIAGLAPGAYRRKFSLPDFARGPARGVAKDELGR